MKDKFFLDTNIIVYTFDHTASQKQKIALNLVDRALINNCGIISYQVIQEFLNVAIKKFAKPMSLNDSSKYLKVVLDKLCKIYPSIELYKNALEIADDTQYSFYDSLIIAAAIEADCSYLYSEDLKDGHIIEGLKIKNPFS